MKVGRIAWFVSAAIVALAFGAEEAASQGDSCSYQGSVYSDGALSCQGGVQVQCLGGRWVNQERTCTEQYGGAGGDLRMESGAEVPAPTDAFMPSDSEVAPPDPNPQDY